jgi:hypothetical protein
LGAFVGEFAVFLGLLVVLLVALELGYRRGLRARREADGPDGTQIGAIQGALLGLLGLLLAFSFAGAAGRFMERQDLIVAEANAIGTAYLRTDLLADPQRTELREVLRRYTEHRLEFVRAERGADDAERLLEAESMHARMWDIALAGVGERSERVLGVLPPLNDVIDLHSSRLASARKHIPVPVQVLLLACSLLSICVIGYGCGRSGRRAAPLTVSLALIVGITLWLTFDLDHPRNGLIRLDDSALEALKFDDG